MNVTAIIEKDEFGFSAYIAEISGVNTQGDTLQEVKDNLREALAIIADIKGIHGCRITRENIIDKTDTINQTSL